MNTLSVKIRYRPVRIGWCIQQNDWTAFRSAVRSNYAVWAGRLNPFIPVYNRDLAGDLIDLFRVDVLLPASKDDIEVATFIAEFKQLPNPFYRDGLFVEYYADRKGPQLLDIAHPITRYYKEHVRSNPIPETRANLYQWDESDPLSDMLLCIWGGFPSVAETGVNFIELITSGLNAETIAIPMNGEIPPIDSTRGVVPAINMLYTKKHHVVTNPWNYAGFYFGSATKFDDLITFWNLRATDTKILFFDPEFADRLHKQSTEWTSLLGKMPSKDHHPSPVNVWHSGEETAEFKKFAEGMGRIRADRALWNGFNIKSPYIYFGGGSALAAVDEETDLPRVTFQLPEKPFEQEPDVFHQHLVIAMNPGIGLFGNERATLRIPYIRRLNAYYGRNCYFEWNKARVEPDGLGIISNATKDDLSITALSVSDLITKIFALAGIKAEPSKPGLIATRLIQQMGKIQDCRVFKIGGVRSLIETYGPDQTFTRSGAVEAIRAMDSDHPLSSYHSLYIEPRKSVTELEGNGIFAYLLRKGLFRAGLQFKCPSCKLEFWVSIDDVRSRTVCEYCGHRFNVTPYLKDRDWAFRRSGLFGRKDNQEGAVPVTVTLQQLDTTIGGLLHTTAMKLTSSSDAGRECETDFVAVVREPTDHKVAIAIGECKNRQEITETDMDNLSAIADALQRQGLEAYVVLSKLIAFTTQEIEYAKTLNKPRRPPRVILLSNKELESYFVYDSHRERLGSDSAAVSLEDMANITMRIFFGRPNVDNEAK